MPSPNPPHNGASRFASLNNVLKLRPDAPPPPPLKDSLTPPSAFYTRSFFSRSAASLSPDSPATPPSPYPPMPPRPHNAFGRASPAPSASGGSLNSFHRSGRDYLPSPSVEGSTDSGGSCPNVGAKRDMYLSNSASSSAYTLSHDTTSSVKPKKSVFKLASLAKRNRSKKDLSDTVSTSGGTNRGASAGESETPKPDGDEGISMPWNFQHHIHVDEGYIGLPPSWTAALSQVGFSENEIATIQARRRAAANLANPRTRGPAAPANSASSSTTLLEPAPRSTSLAKGRDALAINPPSLHSATSSTVGCTSPRTPFSVKSFVTGIKHSLTSDSASEKEDSGAATGEETDQYVLVDGDGPDEASDQGTGDKTVVELYPFDSPSVSSHHSHASRIRQLSQDQLTPRTPAFPQIQVHRARSEAGLVSSPSPAPCAPSPLSHSTSLPLPTPSHGYTYSNNPDPSFSCPGPLSTPPRTPPRRIYHISNASSDGEDYAEPPPAYDSPKKGDWTPKKEKEKEKSTPLGGLLPPIRPIPSVPIEHSLGEPSSVSNQDSRGKVQELSLTETSGYTAGSVDILRTADEVLDISSHYSDSSAHGEHAEMDPARRANVLSPTPPLMIDKRLDKLATLPPRLSFHQEGSLEDWSESLFDVIGGKGKRSSVLLRRKSGDEASVRGKRTTVRPMAPLTESCSTLLETVAPSLPDVSFETNLAPEFTTRPAVEDDKREQAEKDEAEKTKDTFGQDTGKQVVDDDTTATDGSPVVSSTPSVPDALNESSLEPPAATTPSALEFPQGINFGSLPPTPPPKPNPTPPVPITLVPPRTNVITGISGRSPVNSLFGAKPQPLPIPISPSQIRAQLRPAPPKPPHPPPTLPLPPLRRIPSQPNMQPPPPQSPLPPIPSPSRVLKRDLITSRPSSSDSRPNSSQALQAIRANQGDRDSGLSTMTVTPATITTAKTEVVRRATASVVDPDNVPLASRPESTVSTADPEPQNVARNRPDIGRESPRTQEHGEVPGDSTVSETSSVSFLRDGPQSKWPAPPPTPVELEADATPRRLSRFRTTSLGRITQLQAMSGTLSSPIIARFSHGSSDTASSSTGESTPLATPNGANVMLPSGVPTAKGSLTAEARLLNSTADTFGGADIEPEGEEIHLSGTPSSESDASPTTHPLLAQLQPFITPRNPASCFVNLVEIAEGESGSVFAARVTSSFAESQPQGAGNERPIPPGTSHVAIKRIVLPPASSSPSLSDDSPVSNKLVSVLHEYSLLKNLDHEHLLLLDAIYVSSNPTSAEGASTLDTSLWIRMELMERSLADVIGLVAEGLTLQDRLVGRFASDILHGLDYLQRHHIAHRDVRSDNLLVNAIGVVKLADFSNAIRVDRNAPMVKGAVGVIYWQAPEMRAGLYNALKVDIWSLGATVWELAESVPPFSMPASPTAQVPFVIQTSRHVGSQWPPLTHPEHYSRAFHEFLRLCGRESASRPSPGELLNTQFIRNACGRAVILQLLSQCRAIEEAMMANEESIGRS